MGIFKKVFGKKKKQVKPKSVPYVRAKPNFPEGENHIDDPDVKSIADLSKWFPLPSGFSYGVAGDGSPFIERHSDKRQFTFLIEASLLTFDEPQQSASGKTIYKTTEVFKRKG